MTSSRPCRPCSTTGGAGLLVAKILAGRPKDIEDARTLWRLHGPRVDRRRVRRLLRSLEEALGQGDLLPAFDSIAAAMHHD